MMWGGYIAGKGGQVNGSPQLFRNWAEPSGGEGGGGMQIAVSCEKPAQLTWPFFVWDSNRRFV